MGKLDLAATGSFVSGTVKSLNIYHVRRRCNPRVRGRKLLGKQTDRGGKGGRLADAEGAIGPRGHFGHVVIMDGNKIFIMNEYSYQSQRKSQ